MLVQVEIDFMLKKTLEKLTDTYWCTTISQVGYEKNSNKLEHCTENFVIIFPQP